MSTVQNGQIVTNGLVLALDAANSRSYVSGSTVWRDLTPYNVSGSLLNGTSYNSSNLGSIQFDGTDDKIDVENSNSYKPQFPISVSVAFKINSFPTTFTDIFKTDNPVNSWHSGVFLYIRNTYEINLSYGNNTDNASGARRTYTTSTGIISLNSWYVFTAALSTNLSCQAYLNGSEISMPFSGGTATSMVYAGSPMSIGYRYNTTIPSPYLFDGNISNLLIYNKALSATEVLQNYNATKTRFGL